MHFDRKNPKKRRKKISDKKRYKKYATCRDEKRKKNLGKTS